MKLPILICAGALIFPAFAGDGKTFGPFTDPQLKPVVQRLESSTDHFKSTLNHALDSSVLNGTGLEDKLNRWANFLEDEMDNAAKEYGKKNEAAFNQHFENTMMAATAINRAMLRRGFAPEAEKEWGSIRADLTQVARAFGRPSLPNMTVITIVPATATSMGRAEVKQVMDELEASTDRFEDKFEHAWYTDVSGDQREAFRRWADELEDATDGLADEYKAKDVKDWQRKLEESLMVAAGINRVMLASDTSKGPALEWKTVRTHLNTLAKALGYPLLPDRAS